MPSKNLHYIPCIVAKSWSTRVLGLMGKNPPFHPLFIPRCWSIHTFFLRVPLSLVWLDPFFQVVRIDRHVSPWKMKKCKQAVSVLEFSDEDFPSDIYQKDEVLLFPLKP